MKIVCKKTSAKIFLVVLVDVVRNNRYVEDTEKLL